MTIARYTDGVSRVARSAGALAYCSMCKQLTVNADAIGPAALRGAPGSASQRMRFFLSSPTCSHSIRRGIRWKSSSSRSVC
ncbi:hypothetical protein F01_400148 [Burkholderia cenocepacia]|nr:hypothetical protein F01_400148 [Burkholderia cenocepacia]